MKITDKERRALFFDAVGTLIHPDPSAPAVYAAVARRYGSALDMDTITDRFRMPPFAVRKPSTASPVGAPMKTANTPVGVRLWPTP